ncbi:MAG: hypothetical protein EA343_18340 [Nodularia sp. (in: Bacteria)]|nr:MAG: hypothetical protein EA343_18340 [Nodularia sp. (in: cyanobacteria)]
MKLKEGITLFINQRNIELEPDRLSLYEGTILVEECSSNKYLVNQYHPKSCIPKLLSRPLLNVEHNMLCSTNLEKYKMGESLAIFNIPDKILSGFDYVRDSIIKSDINNLVLALDSEESKSSILEVNNYVKQFGEPTGRIALGFNLPNLITVTRQPRDNNKRYMGLHIDGWGLHKEKLERRHLSPVKICVNLGLQERYLLFINLSLQEIYRILKNHGMNDKSYSSEPWNIGNLFMEKLPNYPVIRLKILPNEAYIAPIENIIHDGSTLGCSSYDVNLQIKGYFETLV